MRIGVLHRRDVSDVRALSGCPYFMVKALRRHVGEVVQLGPDHSVVTRSIETGGRAVKRLLHLLFQRRISADHNRILARRLAGRFQPLIDASGCDILFAPNASVEIAFLSTGTPIVYASDLTWANMVEYHPRCSSMFGFARAEADRIEAAGMANAAALVFPSSWAANTAVEHYNIDARRVHCIPYGANFETDKIPSREVALQHSLKGPLRLLLIGVDWEGKGGPIAHECLMELLRRGCDAQLTVCGCIPPERYRHPKVTVVPFLSKQSDSGCRKLSDLLVSAHFFLLPTMADAFPHVLCEASAHGLPSIVRNTGGLSGAIRNGINGFLMAANATGVEYASKVLETVHDPDRYERLVRGSRDAYEQRLNWDSWGLAMNPIFEEALSRRASALCTSAARN